MKIKPDQKWLKKVGNRIIKGREVLGLTQLELSSLVGIYPAALSKIENGKGGVTLQNGIKIAKALGTTVEELFGDSR